MLLEHLGDILANFERPDSDRAGTAQVSLRVGSSATSYTLRDLRGETDYTNIRVHARTAADLESEPAVVKSVTTLPPSMRELLIKEIQRVQAVEGDFVDTEFYQGFLQREYEPGVISRRDDARLG